MHRTPRRRRRGLTLLELVVGVFIAVFLTAAAVAFAAHETKLMGVSKDQLDLSQASRAAIDLLASDIAMAGGGVGFDEQNNFIGISLNRFNIGACAFNQWGGPFGYDPGTPLPAGCYTDINLRTVDQEGVRATAYTMPTQDLLLRFADGAYSTIADYSGSTGQYCAGPGIRFGPGELVLFRTESYDQFKAVQITPGVSGPCSNGQCQNGCVNFSFTNANFLSSSAAAVNAIYTGGEIAGGLKTVAWFVASDGTDGTLRRAVFDQPTPTCAARGNTVGGAVASNVEATYFQIYSFIEDPAIVGPTPRWVNMGQQNMGGLNRFKTRVDVELVMRTRRTANRPKHPVRPMLRTGICAPNIAPCTVQQDYGEREIYRTSVEIKNAAYYK